MYTYAYPYTYEARVLPCCRASALRCRSRRLQPAPSPRRHLLLFATRVHACVRVVACAYACMCTYAYMHLHLHPCAHGRSVSTRPSGPRVAVPAFASPERPWVPVCLSRWPACAQPRSPAHIAFGPAHAPHAIPASLVPRPAPRTSRSHTPPARTIHFHTPTTRTGGHIGVGSHLIRGADM